MPGGASGCYRWPSLAVGTLTASCFASGSCWAGSAPKVGVPSGGILKLRDPDGLAEHMRDRIASVDPTDCQDLVDKADIKDMNEAIRD